jgi:uncharacterized protein (DUF2147 family)
MSVSENFKVNVFSAANAIIVITPTDPITNKPKTDNKHPDTKLHSRPMLGLINLWGFIYNAEGYWENGHIYDPKNGKEYKCTIKLKDINTLNVRGYIGISLIGRSDTWQKLNKNGPCLQGPLRI